MITASTRRARLSRLALALGATAMLAGCAGVGMSEPLVDPARFDFHDCAQLASALAGAKASEAKFRDLMEKGARDPGGGMVVELAYRPQLTQAVSQRRLIERKQVEKNCAAAPG